MKALVKTAAGPGHVELRDMPEPVPGDRQVKLAISACGICGTDLHVLHDTFRNFPPVILGHEFVGRVVEEGRDVRGATEPATRYAVLGATAVSCGRCRWCRGGEFMFCPERRGMGHGVDGAFTSYACARPDQLLRLDDALPDEEGALVEPLAAAVHAVTEVTTLRSGDTALVSGPGPIGLLCLLVLAHHGIKTIVAGTTADAARLALARALGAARVADVQRENLAELVQTETGGAGVDVAFEVAGAAASARACLDALRPLGRYTQVGHFGRDITVPFDRIGFKQLRVCGSVGYTAATWGRTMKLLAQGLRPSHIVTHRLASSAIGGSGSAGLVSSARDASRQRSRNSGVGPAVSPQTSLIISAPSRIAASATPALWVSIDIGVSGHARRSAASAGSTRSISSEAETGWPPGRVDSPPTSSSSAPAVSITLARSTTACVLESWPPSENESGVTFRTPMINVREPISGSRRRCGLCQTGAVRRFSASKCVMPSTEVAGVLIVIFGELNNRRVSQLSMVKFHGELVGDCGFVA